jgi:hypothetical protein
MMKNESLGMALNSIDMKTFDTSVFKEDQIAVDEI